MAALEWIRRDLFDGADAEPLTVETLRTLAPELFATLPLRLMPSLALLPSRFALARYTDLACVASSRLRGLVSMLQ